VSTKKSVRFAGLDLGHHRHLCAFFRDQEEQYEMLLPFVREGIERGEKAFHIVDPGRRQEHLQALANAGVQGEELERRGQLEIRAWEDAYLRGGHFDQDAMLALIEQVLQGGVAQGFALTRLVANMEWALEDRPGVDDLIEYETRLNHILPRYDDPVICTYDLRKFDAGTVIDILRTHPAAVVGGVVQENPFFVPPDELLRELRERRAPSAQA
jgi:hypothetical protein